MRATNGAVSLPSCEQLRGVSGRRGSDGRRASTALVVALPVRRRRPMDTVKGARDVFRTFFLDDVVSKQPSAPSPALYNADLAPTPAGERKLGAIDFINLWVGLVVCIPNYYLAGGLVELGMSWTQGMAAVVLGNAITLVPVILNAHPGTKYGVSFPVLARAAFGVHGAHVPSVFRSLVACGWFGIQTWVGAECVVEMLASTAALLGSALSNALGTVGLASVAGPAASAATALGQALSAPSPLGITFAQALAFAGFLGFQALIVVRGMDAIKRMEAIASPLLIALCLALLAWAVLSAGGFGPMLSAPSQYAPGMPLHGTFWPAFLAAVTANVGAWASLSLNISDFSRYARSQREQAVGQAVGLPLTMTAFAFIGLAVTSATAVLYGRPVSDPVALMALLPGPLPKLLASVGLLVATLSTNIAANLVAPATALMSLFPRSVTFARGAVGAALLGALLQPWKILQSTSGFILTWLVGYSALLGPVGGIVVADYFWVRGRQLDVDGLYASGLGSPYYYAGGFHLLAMAALVIGVLPSLPGFLAVVGAVPSSSVPAIFHHLYSAAWMVGFVVASAVYCGGWALARRDHASVAQTAAA